LALAHTASPRLKTTCPDQGRTNPRARLSAMIASTRRKVVRPSPAPHTRQRAAPAMRSTELLPQASVSALCPRRNARAWCRATTRPLRVRREQPSNAHQPPSPRPHPAVGAYEDPRSFSRELRSRYAAGGGTSSFRPPSQRPVEVVDEPEPGPGAYSARKANLSSYGCAPIPALRSALLPAVRRPMRLRHGSLPSECTSD